MVVVEVEAGEGELLARLAGQYDGKRVDRGAEVEDIAVGTGVDVGRIDIAVVDMHKGHHGRVGTADNDDAVGGIVYRGFIHHHLHLGNGVDGRHRYST